MKQQIKLKDYFELVPFCLFVRTAKQPRRGDASSGEACGQESQRTTSLNRTQVAPV